MVITFKVEIEKQRKVLMHVIVNAHEIVPADVTISVPMYLAVHIVLVVASVS